EELRRVGAVGLVAHAGAARIDGDAGEVPRILGNLERVAGVVGGEVRGEDQRVALTLRLGVGRDAIGRERRPAVLVGRRGAGGKEVGCSRALGEKAWCTPSQPVTSRPRSTTARSSALSLS